MDVNEPSAKYLAAPNFKPSPLGPVPIDWRLGVVNDLASRAANAIVGGPFGSDLTAKDYVDDGVPVIRGQNMSGKWIAGPYAFVSHKKAAQLEANLARPGDIVFTQRGSLGQVSLVPIAPFPKYLVSQSQMKLTVERKLAVPEFFYYLFISPGYQSLIASSTVQTGVPHINLGILRRLPAVMPPVAEQDEIARALADSTQLIEFLEQLIAKKRQIKQGAMQELLTGKKRLPGFTAEWLLQPFARTLVRLNAKANQIASTDYQAVGQLPVVDQGKLAVVGFTDRAEKRFACPTGGVIVFGDHTCVVKFVDFDFVVGADGTQVLVGAAGQSTLFHAYQLQLRPVESTGYNRHFKFLTEREYRCPTLAEQVAIAGVLADLDAELTALETKLAKARALKHAMSEALLTGRIRPRPPAAAAA